MQLDARKLPATTVFDADICIVGAGPAGLTLAREFVGSKPTVLILESGGLNSDRRAQELNEGAVIGDAYAGLRRTRHRQVGGTAHLWNTDVSDEIGAKYVPLDPSDFEKQANDTLAEWPIEYSQLEPYYRRAQVVCGLGPFAYEGADWSDENHPLLRLNVDELRTKVYQCGVGRLFTDLSPREIAQSGNITLCHHATICGLKMPNGTRAVEAAFASLSGNRFCARAKIFVLAAGAIENARLLLLSGDGASDEPGNRHGWVGRCFMEHPRDHALTLIPRSPELFQQAAFYDLHSARDGTIVGGRIALDRRAIRDAGLPNASITLMPCVKSPAARLPKTIARVADYLNRFIGSERQTGYGWSRNQKLSQIFDAFELLINFEQRPNPENRVVLAQTRDPLGMPRAELHWRWSDEEQANLERLRRLIAEALEATGIGHVEVRAGLRPDPNAHHHAGTTRMHADPRWGVVNADGRVHGTDNMYVTGSSILCRAGFANPTLTIVALALRLSDHLKHRL